MAELIAVAYPGFYVEETYRLGRYVGLWCDGQLVAMAGERFKMAGLREISAVCTRPGFTGRGYAQHLMRRLLAAPEPGDTSFLHVTATNARAVGIYEQMGFERV